MRHRFLLHALALASLAGMPLLSQAQTPPPPAPADVAPPALRGPAGMAPPDATAVTFDGSVARTLVNPNGEVDGLLLRDGTQVGMPPHLSAQLIALAKPGDAVRVQGLRLAGVPLVRATTLTNLATNKSLADQPPDGAPAARPAPPALAPMQAGGKVERLLYGGRGEANGVLLSDGTVVRVAPHAVAQFVDLMRPGASLQAQGYGVATANGRAVEAAYVGADASSLRAVFGEPRRGPRPGARGPGAGPMPGPDAAPAGQPPRPPQPLDGPPPPPGAAG